MPRILLLKERKRKEDGEVGGTRGRDVLKTTRLHELKCPFSPHACYSEPSSSPGEADRNPVTTVGEKNCRISCHKFDPPDFILNQS